MVIVSRLEYDLMPAEVGNGVGESKYLSVYWASKI